MNCKIHLLSELLTNYATFNFEKTTLMKTTFIITMLFLLPSFSNAQDWENVGGGLDDNVYDMINYDGELFVGGKFIYKVQSWNGLNWTTYNHLSFTGIAFPLTFSVFNDTLYTGGDYPYVGSQSKIYKLENGSWEPVGGIFDESSWSSTKKLITFDSILVSGGRFSSIGGVPINNVAAWDGNSWNPMGDGLNDVVLHFGIHQNRLFATGQFTASGSDTTVKRIAKWTGQNWECFDSSVVFNSASTLKSYQGDLLIGNVWDTIGGIEMNGIARWDGTNYTSMGDTIFKGVGEFWEFNGELYIGANLVGSNPWITDRAVMKWNGIGWDQVGSQFNQTVICLEDYDNMLFCGGQYSNPTSYLSRFNPSLGVFEHDLNQKKEVVKIVDLMGRETEFKPNTALIYIYNDGTTEKVFRIE